LQPYTDNDLPDEAFADDINRLFPIDSAVAVTQTFDNFGVMPYKIYDTAEYLYVLDRICKAAEEFEVEFNLEESTGGRKMIDKNSPEFRAAVAEETEKLMANLVDKDKRVKAIEDLKAELSVANATIKQAMTDKETAQAEKEKSEQTFKEYRDQVEAASRLRERMGSLAEIGLKITDEVIRKETEDAVAEMSDKVFALYKKQLAESVKYFDEEEKKKKDEEEMKKKKEKDKAKASTDIVAESRAEGDLPIGEVNNDPFKTFDKVLANF
jgi:hypothetical protein